MSVELLLVSTGERASTLDSCSGSSCSEPTPQKHFNWNQGMYLMGKHSRLCWKHPSFLGWIVLQVGEVGMKCFPCLSRGKVLSPVLLCCQKKFRRRNCVAREIQIPLALPFHVYSPVLCPPWLDCRPSQARSLASSLVQGRSNALSCPTCTLGKVQTLELMQLRLSVEPFLVRQRLIFFFVNSCLICLP